jgi:DNA-3-methyladenine glycosylase II
LCLVSENSFVGWLMTDHPSWTSQGRTAFRVVRSGSSVWVLSGESADGLTTGVRLRAARIAGSGEEPVVGVFDPRSLCGPQPLVGRLCESGTVARWRNPDLWDAVATAVIRQVIRAGHARKLYRELCRAHGDRVATPFGAAWLLPSPTIVLDLSDGEFARLGLTFKRNALRAVAEACLEFGSKWSRIPPADLRSELQSIPRVGPWTAGAAVADLSNDYMLYPFADLAVRTWAARLAPERRWPETEQNFARMWAQLAGDQLDTWTLLTLAWGNRHANGATL